MSPIRLGTKAPCRGSAGDSKPCAVPGDHKKRGGGGSLLVPLVFPLGSFCILSPRASRGTTKANRSSSPGKVRTLGYEKPSPYALLSGPRVSPPYVPQGTKHMWSPGCPMSQGTEHLWSSGEPMSRGAKHLWSPGVKKGDQPRGNPASQGRSHRTTVPKVFHRDTWVPL